jgi:hypothetical protein
MYNDAVHRKTSIPMALKVPPPIVPQFEKLNLWLKPYLNQNVLRPATLFGLV